MTDHTHPRPAAGSPVDCDVGRLVECCGLLHDGGVIGPEDPSGCLLPNDHDGPHEFEAIDGTHWHWETDMECACEHCMRCDGDYCTVYWRKPPNAEVRR